MSKGKLPCCCKSIHKAVEVFYILISTTFMFQINPLLLRVKQNGCRIDNYRYIYIIDVVAFNETIILTVFLDAKHFSHVI